MMLWTAHSFAFASKRSSFFFGSAAACVADVKEELRMHKWAVTQQNLTTNHTQPLSLHHRSGREVKLRAALNLLSVHSINSINAGLLPPDPPTPEWSSSSQKRGSQTSRSYTSELQTELKEVKENDTNGQRAAQDDRPGEAKLSVGKVKLKTWASDEPSRAVPLPLSGCANEARLWNRREPSQMCEPWEVIRRKQHEVRHPPPTKQREGRSEGGEERGVGGQREIRNRQWRTAGGKISPGNERKVKRDRS